MEQTDGVEIKHVCNGHEYRLPELPYFSVDGYSAETNKIYEHYGIHLHGNTCQPFREVANTNADTLAARYKQKMSRLAQITRAGNKFKFQWECEFDDGGIVKPLLHTHPAVRQDPLCTRDAVYGGRTEAMRLNYKAWECETIQYVDVMSLYPYICKYFKFTVGHPVFHFGDECKDKQACLRMDGLIQCSIVPPEVVSSRAPLPSQQEKIF